MKEVKSHSLWIDARDLKNKNIRIVKAGIIGGCVYIPYVITDDGKVYFVQLSK